MFAIPRRTPVIHKRILWHILRYFVSKKIRNRDHTRQLGMRFSEKFNRKHVIFVSSGRLALSLILEALNLPEKSKVILPAYTDLSVPLIIRERGLEPDFCDVDKIDHNMHIDSASRLISDKTSAIIATHLFGFPFDTGNLKTKLDESGAGQIDIIEDCSHSYGTDVIGRQIGSDGRAVFLSLSATKKLHSFGGGVILTDDTLLYGRLVEKVTALPEEKISATLKTAAKILFLRILTGRLVFTFTIFPILCIFSLFNRDLLGFYVRLFKPQDLPYKKNSFSNFKSYLGLIQLEAYEKSNVQNKNNALLLEKMLKPEIRRQIPRLNGTELNYYFFNILVSDKKRLSSVLLKHGIDTGKFVMRNCPVYFNEYNKTGVLAYKNTEYIYNSTLQIPVHESVKTKDIYRISRIINLNYEKGETL